MEGLITSTLRFELGFERMDLQKNKLNQLFVYCSFPTSAGQADLSQFIKYLGLTWILHWIMCINNLMVSVSDQSNKFY